MAAFTTVLCATDLSEGADEAIRAAGRSARLHDASLVLVHALPHLGTPMTPDHVEQELFDREALAAELGDKLAERVERLTGLAGDQVAVRIEDGPTDAAVLRTAAEIVAELVVIGASGASGVRRLFLGSNAVTVVRSAPTSVLVAREERAGGPVVVSTDFSEAAEPAVRMAFDEARLRRATLVLHHSVEVLSPEVDLAVPGVTPSAVPFEATPVEEMRAAARRRLGALAGSLKQDAGPQLPVEIAVDVGPPAPVIVALAERIGADLVVVGTDDRKGIDRLLLGSVAEVVVREAPCSVLVSRARRQPASRA